MDGIDRVDVTDSSVQLPAEAAVTGVSSVVVNSKSETLPVGYSSSAPTVDAWATLLSRGGGLAEIARYLAILAAYAVVLLAIASLRLRRSLVTP